MEKDINIETLTQRVETFAPLEHRLTDWGMIDLRHFGKENEMGSFLSSCKKKVIILKTWFPEDDFTAGGLEAAMNGGATIQMILCNPKAPILGKRAKSTEHTHEQAAEWIYHGLDMVLKNASPTTFKGIGFYDTWPGCPVIWADHRMFMGFYLWRYTSPNQRWVEVEVKSDLWVALENQKTHILKDAVQLGTLDKLRTWIKDNPLDELLEWIKDNPLDELLEWGIKDNRLDELRKWIKDNPPSPPAEEAEA